MFQLTDPNNISSAKIKVIGIGGADTTQARGPSCRHLTTTPGGTLASSLTRLAACILRPSSDRIVFPTPMTTVSEGKQTLHFTLLLRNSAHERGPAEVSPRLLTISFPGNDCAVRWQVPVRRRNFVSGENALHHAVLFLDGNQHGHIDVVNEKGPQTEHHQEMNFT